MTRLLRAAFFVVLSAPVFGQQGGVQQGEYLDGSGGTLVIRAPKGGGLPFTLRTVGGNRHICEAEGVIGKNGQAVLKQDDETCTLAFTSKGGSVEVETKGPCRAFCGARATLDGTFHKPEAGCERAAVRKTRNQFKQLYDKKAYPDARKTLEPLLANCKKTLDLDDDARIRNDLAVTLYHLGDSAACRKVLEPLAEDAAKSDEKIRADYPPSDADMMLPMVRATRTNLKLCQGSKKP